MSGEDLKCDDSWGFYITQFVKAIGIICCVGVLLNLFASLSGAEIFKIPLPIGTASCNGDFSIKGGQVKEIYTQDGNKMVEVNNGKFIVYDISSNLVFGQLYFDIDVTSKAFELRVNLTCASKDAAYLKSNGYYEKRWTYLGVNKIMVER